MHPIERLRWIARAEGEADTALAAEAAFTLAELAEQEPVALLTASRRLLERHPACGPLWWVCARLLEEASGADPYESGRRLAVELVGDGVARSLARALRADLSSNDVIVATLPNEALGAALGLGAATGSASSPLTGSSATASLLWRPTR